MSIFFPPYVALDEAVLLLSEETGAKFTRDWVMQLVQNDEIKFYFRPQSDLYVQHEMLEKSFLHIRPGKEHPLPKEWADIFTANVNRDGKIRVRTLPDGMGAPQFIQDAKTDERVELAISIDDVRFSSDELRRYIFSRKSSAMPAVAGTEHIMDATAEALSSYMVAADRAKLPVPAWVSVKKRVTLLTGADRISIAATLDFVLKSADFPPTLDVFMEIITDENGNETIVPDGAVQVQPSDGRSLAAGSIKKSFIAFCAERRIIPRDPYTPWVLNYDSSNASHDALYEITTAEMQAFAEGYRLEVIVAKPAAQQVVPDQLSGSELRVSALEHSGHAQLQASATMTAEAMVISANGEMPTQAAIALPTLVHKLGNRTHKLDSEIADAKSRALVKTDPASVYAELVKMAEDKVGSLRGAAEGVIKYQYGDDVKMFTLKNLRDRMRRPKAR